MDGVELDRVWDHLRAHGRTIVLQAHTHPGSAHHSGIDDRYPVVPSRGFLSLVLARFGEQGMAEAHLEVADGSGGWRTVDLEDALVNT